MCFSNNLKRCRLQKQMTQRALAELIGVAPSTYSQYESGTREPDVEKIKIISKILNVSADYLLFGNSKQPQKKHTLYDTLNKTGKAKADEYIEDLADNPKYTQQVQDNKTEFAPDMFKAITDDIERIVKKGSSHIK